MTTKTRRVAALLSFCALALAVVAQYYFARKRDYMWDGILLYSIAAVLFILVVRLTEGRAAEKRGLRVREIKRHRSRGPPTPWAPWDWGY